jgi:hypothetical protein
MRFKTFLSESLVNGPQDLPPIPAGMMRLVHFTSEPLARQVMASGLNYGRQGEIDSTADSYSTNQQVYDHIVNHGFYTGDNEGMKFDRSKFGDTCVLMDMSRDHHRAHNNMSVAPGKVDNRHVAGYVVKGRMEFMPNPQYAPASVEIQKREPMSLVRNSFGTGSNVPITTPQVGSNSLDVW